MICLTGPIRKDAGQIRQDADGRLSTAVDQSRQPSQGRIALGDLASHLLGSFCVFAGQNSALDELDGDEPLVLPVGRLVVEDACVEADDRSADEIPRLSMCSQQCLDFAVTRRPRTSRPGMRRPRAARAPKPRGRFPRPFADTRRSCAQPGLMGSRLSLHSVSAPNCF